MLSHTIIRAAMFACTLVLAIASPILAYDLLNYTSAPDSAYKWSVDSEPKGNAGKPYILDMTSQVWQGIAWRHKIELVVPAKCDHPDVAILFLTFGKPGEDESQVARMLAAGSGCPTAVLYGIPNQPLFDDLHEDGLIAYTFVKFFETGDSTWPLLLPMTKSALRAMDTIQEFSKQKLDTPVRKFIVSGASKRGWTTWLTAAASPERVAGIVPLVYDNLNLKAQMKAQIDYYGSYSERIKDYTSRGIQEKLNSSVGDALSKIVDPWSYRSRITMPKLIINGTNDAYWTVDALNRYWDDLAGSKNVLYMPNAGHNLSGQNAVESLLKVVNASASFARAVASGSKIEQATWRFTVDKNAATLNIACPTRTNGARLWTARSASRDFRESKWESTPMTPAGYGFTAGIELPKEGCLAVMGEYPARFGEGECRLCTQIKVFGDK